jgi:hypothetical protein
VLYGERERERDHTNRQKECVSKRKLQAGLRVRSAREGGGDNFEQHRTRRAEGSFELKERD